MNKLKIYVRSSPNPLYFENVECLVTEGNLLRLSFIDRNEWFPLGEIFKIVEDKFTKTTKSDKLIKVEIKTEENDEFPNL